MNKYDLKVGIALRGFVFTASLSVAACGDSAGSSASEATSATGSAGSTGASATSTATTSGGSESESNTGPTTSGASISESGTTTGTTTGPTSSASGTSTTQGVTESSSGTTDVSTSTTSTTGTTTGDTTTGDNPCGGFKVLDFSYIWIANSVESTLSKIDTKTGVEFGRYFTNGDPLGNAIGGPSRTSVSVHGDAVVADRQGFLVKFHAIEERCTDKNNNGMIDTSTSQVPLQYGDDECLAWSVALPTVNPPQNVVYQGGPRAVQWTAPSVCNGEDSNVWVGWCDPLGRGRVQLHDGNDGAVIHSYDLGFQCSGNSAYGPYGGVVDDANDLWVMSRSGNVSNSLFRVSYGCDPNQGTCVTQFPPPLPSSHYGINIGPDGHIWMTAFPDRLVRFDPVALTWDNYDAELDAALPPGDNLLRGLVIDEDGIVWIALGNSQVGIGPNPRLIRVDPSVEPATVQTWGPETITELLNPVGMSLDVDGFVWMVDSAANKAYKIDRADPTSYTVVGGLVTPYTYSDMTGYGLSLVVPG